MLKKCKILHNKIDNVIKSQYNKSNLIRKQVFIC